MAEEAATEEPAVVGASEAAEASSPIPLDLRHLRHQAATTTSIQCSVRPPKMTALPMMMTALQTAAEAESAAVVVVAVAAGFLLRFLKTAILRHSFLCGYLSHTN